MQAAGLPSHRLWLGPLDRTLATDPGGLLDQDHGLQGRSGGGVADMPPDLRLMGRSLACKYHFLMCTAQTKYHMQI